MTRVKTTGILTRLPNARFQSGDRGDREKKRKKKGIWEKKNFSHPKKELQKGGRPGTTVFFRTCSIDPRETVRGG